MHSLKSAPMSPLSPNYYSLYALPTAENSSGAHRKQLENREEIPTGPCQLLRSPSIGWGQQAECLLLDHSDILRRVSASVRKSGAVLVGHTFAIVTEKSSNLQHNCSMNKEQITQEKTDKSFEQSWFSV